MIECKHTNQLSDLVSGHEQNLGSQTKQREKLKTTWGWYFIHLPAVTPPLGRSGKRAIWYRWRNHPCQILWQSVLGVLESDTPNFSFSIGIAGRNSVSTIVPHWFVPELSVCTVQQNRTQFLATLLSSSLGVATVVVVAVSMTGAWEATDASVVGVATATSQYDHSTILELVSARRHTYDRPQRLIRDTFLVL